MEYFYHYTTIKNFREIQKNGLQPSRSLVGMGDRRDTADLDRTPAIFGLPSSAPERWMKCYVRMPDDFSSWPLLADLLSSIAERPSNRSRGRNDLVLLKVRLQPEDEVYVSDFAKIWKAHGDIDEDVVKEYGGSLTKLQSDFDIAAKKLPEILCFNHIPPERIEFVEQIPARTSHEILAHMDRIRNPGQVLPQQFITRPKKRLMTRLLDHFA